MFPLNLHQTTYQLNTGVQLRKPSHLRPMQGWGIYNQIREFAFVRRSNSMEFNFLQRETILRRMQIFNFYSLMNMEMAMNVEVGKLG